MDKIGIRRVANGWVIEPCTGRAEFTHVAITPQSLAMHIQKWAEAQVEPMGLIVQRGTGEKS